MANASYERLGVLGRGGFGEVLLAREVGESGFTRQVALKMLHPDAPDLGALVDRLRAEARTLAQIRHRAVVGLHDLVQIDGRWAIVMEYVEGRDLSDVLAGGPLAAPAAVEVAAEVAGALDAAVHTQDDAGRPLRMLHRDVKPANIRITPRGEVKLLDFGIAGLARRADEGTLGSPPYMAPERFLGRDHPASDVYSLGVTLAEALGAPIPERAPAERAAHDAHVERLLASIDPSPEIAELLRAMLAFDAASRPTPREVQRRCALLGHGGEALRRWAESPTSDVARGATPLPASRSDITFVFTRANPRAPATNVVRPADSFLGRVADLARVREALSRSRLVTLMGPGGTGKTRLAREHALTDLPRWPGGVWFCDLADATDAAAVSTAVGRALGIPLGEDAPGHLAFALASRPPSLLLLDNCEQVVADAAALVDRWRAETPASFLVTTRQRLGLAGEVVLALEPLAEDDAVALYQDRARDAGGDDQDADADVRELVTLLDRLPLAIELAAGRARLMSARALVPRLTQRLDVVRANRRDLAPRQQTLRAAVDWSWDLLAPWEKGAFAQLSAFDGGFSLDAAESVLDLDAWPDAPWVLDVVQALVDKSLIREQPGPTGTRFTMLLTVIDYGREKLAESGQLAATLRRRARWFATLGASDRLRTLSSSGFQELVAELDNLSASVRSFTTAPLAEADPDAFRIAFACADAAVTVVRRRGPFDRGRQIVADLDEIASTPAERAEVDLLAIAALQSSGHLTEAIARAERAEQLAEEAGNERLAGRARVSRGQLLAMQGDQAGSRALLDRAIADSRRSGDRWELARALYALGHLDANTSAPLDALGSLRTAERIFADFGDLHARAMVRADIGVCLARAGRYEEAWRTWLSALPLLERADNLTNLAYTLGNLAEIAVHVGRPVDETWSYHRAAVQTWRTVGGRLGEAVALGGLAEFQLAQGRPTEALEPSMRALELVRPLGHRRRLAEAVLRLAKAEHELGRWHEARDHVAEAVALYRALGDGDTFAEVLRLEGRILEACGRPEEAAERFAEADALFRDG